MDGRPDTAAERWRTMREMPAPTEPAAPHRRTEPAHDCTMPAAPSSSALRPLPSPHLFPHRRAA